MKFISIATATCLLSLYELLPYVSSNPRLDVSQPALDHAPNDMKDYELIAQQVSGLAEKIDALTRRVNDVEKVNARLEAAALTAARALQEIATHWDDVYVAMRRKEDEPKA